MSDSTLYRRAEASDYRRIALHLRELGWPEENCAYWDEAARRMDPDDYTPQDIAAWLVRVANVVRR